MAEYTYNSNGIRTSKTVNGVRTDYTLNNTTIIAETTNGKTTWYDYDASGMPVGFTADEQSYYYKKNAQGDIVAILDSDGVELAGYTYDAWGNITDISGDETLAESNPFRYRGYYQDNESGFFYLQSRYYDGVVGRFVNADVLEVMFVQPENVFSTNLFTYCNNNAINYCDPSGCIAIVDDIFFLGVAVGVLAVLLVTTYYMTTPQFQQSWYNFSVSIANGLTALWNRITVLFQSATQVVTKAVEQNITKAKSIIQQKRNIDYYWIASSVTFRRKNVSLKTYFPCMPISKSAAAAYVRAYGDVFASSQSAAYRLAITAGYGNTPSRARKARRLRVFRALPSV